MYIYNIEVHGNGLHIDPFIVASGLNIHCINTVFILSIYGDWRDAFKSEKLPSPTYKCNTYRCAHLASICHTNNKANFQVSEKLL